MTTELEQARFVSVERDGTVATVIMNRPPVNAIAPELIHQLAEEFTALGEDESVRAIVLTSAIDRYFMAGADLKMMSAAVPDGSSAWESAENLAFRFSVIERVPKPVIAAIQGHALGGGCELALCCDYRYMIDDSRSTIGLTETTLGLIPGAGGTQRLPRLVGKSRGLQMIIEGTRLRAPDAAAIGLVDVALPPETFHDAVREKAAQLAAMATRAVGAAKIALLEGLDTSVEEGLRREQKGFIDVLGSSDVIEGVGAFLEKRPPNFTGR
jgi:enoyl-CoA hydratase